MRILLVTLALCCIQGMLTKEKNTTDSTKKSHTDSTKKSHSHNDEDDIIEEDKWMVTKTAYFDMQVNFESAGRVLIALFGEAAPNTVNNFAALAKGNYKGEKGFGYKDSRFHRVVKDFIIQGGDFTHEDGTGGKSIYGLEFDDEPFHHSHNTAGMVAMANRGTKDTNGSQFYVTMGKARWLDGKHVVFGKVIEGMDIVQQINEIGIGKDGKLKQLAIIEDCGLVRHAPYVLEKAQRK